MSTAASLPEVCGGGDNGCFSTADPNSETSEGGACVVRSVKSKVSSSNLQPMEAANIVFTADKDLLPCCSKLGKVYNPQRKGEEITMAYATSRFQELIAVPIMKEVCYIAVQTLCPQNQDAANLVVNAVIFVFNIDYYVHMC